MIGRRDVLLGAAGATVGAMALGGCALFETNASYRFRMTVHALTPAGLRSASTVLQVNAMKGVKLLPEEHPGGVGIAGEAVVLDFPQGPVFALLTIGDAKQLLPTQVTKALDPAVNTADAASFVAAVKRLGGRSANAKAELTRDDWPMMVRFGDLKDPASVEQVDPDAIGVKRILLETTRDQVTKGIEKRMPPWFMQLVKRKASLSGSTSLTISTNDLADKLSPGSFSTEIWR